MSIWLFFGVDCVLKLNVSSTLAHILVPFNIVTLNGFCRIEAFENRFVTGPWTAMLNRNWNPLSKIVYSIPNLQRNTRRKPKPMVNLLGCGSNENVAHSSEIWPTHKNPFLRASLYQHLQKSCWERVDLPSIEPAINGGSYNSWKNLGWCTQTRFRGFFFLQLLSSHRWEEILASMRVGFNFQ